MSGTLVVFVKDCSDLKDTDGIGAGKSDPYVYLEIEGCDAKKTATKNDDLNPEWNEEIVFRDIEFPCSKSLRMRVYDSDVLGDDKIGEIVIPLGSLRKGGPQSFSETVSRKFLGLMARSTLNFDLTTDGWGMCEENTLQVHVQDAQNLDNTDGVFRGKSDPYVYMTLEGCDPQRTSVKESDLNPKWNEDLIFEGIKNPGTQKLKIYIYDKDTVHDDKLGCTEIDLGTLYNHRDPQPFNLVVQKHMLHKNSTLNLTLTTNGWGNN